METQDQQNNPYSNQNNPPYREWKKDESRNGLSGRALAGVLIITVGVLLLADRSGAINLPEWLVSWPMILITVGTYLGVRHGFRGPAWIIMILVGSIFLVGEINDELDFRNYTFPLIVIAIGLVMIFRPQKKNREKWRKSMQDMKADITSATTSNARATSDDFLDTVTVFGGVKKNIISKTFQGGELTTFFGGTELNLTQADVNGRVVIEITQMFGGTKLIVPPNWRIKSDDMVAIFGGLDDKRPTQNEMVYDNEKVLVLRGTCIFGGIEIRSY
jgi:predicted membrane protein